MKKLLAFSLIELMISLITISCIVAAFTPVVTKKLKNSNVIEGIDKFINTGGIKIQTLNFSCIKGLCSFSGACCV